MDEADRLLDMGFKRDIDAIIGFLNKRNANTAVPTSRNAEKLGPRQTLLFSATIPAEVREIADKTLLRGYKTINTLGEEEEQTHSHVEQKVSYQ